MEEQVERKTKDRSPNFPFINLAQAVERAKAFYDQERKGAAPITRAGIHWKYSPNSSGLIQTVSALKSYGLMTDEGSGDARRLKLTELALRIVLDTRTDSPERPELLRRSALSPNVSGEVHANWPDGLPSDETLNHYLVLERSFAPASAVRAARILKENQEFARLNAAGSISSDATSVSDRESYKEVIESESVDGSSAVRGDNYATQQQRANKPFSFIARAREEAEQRRFEQRKEEFVEQVLDPEGRTIRIEFAVAPTIEMYEFLGDYFELRLKVLRRKATGHAPTVAQTTTTAPTPAPAPAAAASPADKDEEDL